MALLQLDMQTSSKDPYAHYWSRCPLFAFKQITLYIYSGPNSVPRYKINHSALSLELLFVQCNNILIKNNLSSIENSYNNKNDNKLINAYLAFGDKTWYSMISIKKKKSYFCTTAHANVWFCILETYILAPHILE